MLVHKVLGSTDTKESDVTYISQHYIATEYLLQSLTVIAHLHLGIGMCLI